MTHTLYRFCSRDDELLYVGITGNLTQRLVQHQRKKTWWDSIAFITLQHYDTRTEVLLAEKHAIEIEHPKWNVVYNSDRLAKALSVEIEPVVEMTVDSYNGIRVGDCIGVALVDAELVLVGLVAEVDAGGILLELISWLTGFFDGEERFLAWDHVLMWRKADRTTPEAARAEGFLGHPGDRVWDVARLAKWQDDYRTYYRQANPGDRR